MTTEGFRRKLTAIISADVEGYSRLMGEDEEATVRTLTAHREVMSILIEKHLGRVVDSPGDNVLAEFASVVDAVRSAVEIQEELKARNAELQENRRMAFRIGINLGDVIEEGGRIYGDGVNVAARVEGLADGGGICISGSAYEQIKNKLALGYEYLGEHTVKNIAEPVRVYKAQIEPEAKRAEKKTRFKRWHWAAMTLVIVVAGVLAIWNFFLRPSLPSIEPASVERMAFPLPDKPSIAVLPFDNIGGDPKEDYLSDGITEQIITGLSKTPKLFVISRYSMLSYKGKPVKVQKVAEELGVRYVLEGSVQRSGQRVRTTAQLIDAITGHHLWAERYDRDLKDIFALQDEITMKVIMALQVKLTEGEIASIYGKGTCNLEAYLKLLKGYDHLTRGTKDDNEIAKRLFGEAIELNPDYANAYMLLAWTFYDEALLGWTKKRAESYDKTLELAKKAISLDEFNLKAHMLIAWVAARRGNRERAVALAKKAFDFDPNNGHANAHYGGILQNTGKYKEAIPFLEKAIRLDPIPLNWIISSMGSAYLWTGQTEKAVATFTKLVSRDLRGHWAHCAPRWLGIALRYAGKPEEAIAMFNKALSLNPVYDPYPPFFRYWYKGELALARLEAGQPEEAIKMLEEVLSRDPDNALVCSYFSNILGGVGRHEEALEMALFKASRTVSYRPFWYHQDLGNAYFRMGQYDRAIERYKFAIVYEPENLYGHISLAAAYGLAGRDEDARAEAGEVLRINPKFSLEDYAKGGHVKRFADKESYINALRNAGLK